VFRPGDVVETAEAWQCALTAHDRPSVLALSRQGLEQFRLGDLTANKTAGGAYVVAGSEIDRQVTILATGSEVSIALAARQQLAADGIAATVVSVPCMELLREQDAAARDAILGSSPRIAVEAAIRQPWDWMLRDGDDFIGMDDFGASGPAGALFEHFGITAEAIAARARAMVA
jgi:transketolase